MKEILKYGFAAVMVALGFASCEELPDYQTTIDAAPELVYVDPKGGDTFSTLVVHRPVGSTGSFLKEFQVNVNTTEHSDAAVTVAYAPDLVAEYNQTNGTSYAVLPEEYFILENDVVTVHADTTASRDTVRIRLNEEADLSALTERGYLAPFKLMSKDLAISEQMSNLWFVVNTEINLIRPLDSADDMVGFPASGASAWTADFADANNLFDENNSTSVSFSNLERNVIEIDMKQVNMVTGFKLNTYAIGDFSIEYSEDGETWNQAGTPVEGEYIATFGSWSAGDYYVAVYDYFSARYLRLSFNMTSSYYTTMNELSVYVIDSTEPTIYTVTGADNVVTGKIVHRKGSDSIAEFDHSFNVSTTVASETGYTVSAVYDNALVAAYNAKHGTAYKALPAGNLSIEPSSVSIAANGTTSEDKVTLSLTGDLTSLTDENGYLATVKLSASGAETSEGRGVVYAIIKSENNLIKPISSVNDIVGFPAGGRSSWSSDSDSDGKLFDDNTGTSVGFAASGNVLTVNLGGTHLVTGLDMTTYQMNNVSIEYSVDGSSWKSAGTAASSEVVFTGSSWSQGHYYIAFTEILEAAYLRLSFGYSGWYRNMSEFSIYELESNDPTVYTVCGTDNVFTGKVIHHVTAGSISGVNVSFNAMTTHASDAGYSVNAVMDNSLVSTYNSAHNTDYAQIDPSYVEISGVPCEIAAGANKSEGQISVTLTGNLSKLTNKKGYVIPVKLSASGAVTSEKRGIVYVVVSVEESDAKFMSDFTASDIIGTLVADRSGWSIVACDAEGIHSGSYEELFDDNTATYIRTWGGPVSFTVDLGKEVEMTGLQITARTDNNTYASYQPNGIQIMGSLDGDSYTDIGMVEYSAGTIYRTTPTSYVALYAPERVRYLKIEASYGSNMGSGDFNIYVK